MKGPTVQFRFYIFHESENSYLVGTELWHRETEDSFHLPKSQAEPGPIFSENGTEWADFEITEWIAEKKGLDVSTQGNDNDPDDDLFEEFFG